MSETTSEPMNAAFPRPPHVVRPLPESRNVDGRPVWEPPVFNYSLWIGDEYEKQREAVLKYYEGDVVKTTKFFDLDVENDLLVDYEDWVFEYHEDWERESFWRNLKSELLFDTIEVQEELRTLKTVLLLQEDGTYYVKADDQSEYTITSDGSQSLRENSLRDVSAANEEEPSSSHPSQHAPENNRHPADAISKATPLLPAISFGTEDENCSRISEHVPRMELHPRKDGDESTPLLPTLGPSHEMQDNDAKAWNAVLCGCPCS